MPLNNTNKKQHNFLTLDLRFQISNKYIPCLEKRNDISWALYTYVLSFAYAISFNP